MISTGPVTWLPCGDAAPIPARRCIRRQSVLRCGTPALVALGAASASVEVCGRALRLRPRLRAAAFAPPSASLWRTATTRPGLRAARGNAATCGDVSVAKSERRCVPAASRSPARLRRRACSRTGAAPTASSRPFACTAHVARSNKQSLEQAAWCRLNLW